MYLLIFQNAKQAQLFHEIMVVSMFLRITGSVIRGCTDIEKCSILNEVITWKTSGYDQVSALSDWLLTNRLSADIVQEEKPRKKMAKVLLMKHYSTISCACAHSHLSVAHVRRHRCTLTKYFLYARLVINIPF